MQPIDYSKASHKQLREFGLIFGAMLVLFFGLLIPWLWDLGWPRWPWGIAAVFALVAFAYPPALKPVYILWMKIGNVLGWINTRLILGLVFFLIFVPAGVVMRLFNDPMHRKFNADNSSYRTPSKGPVAKNLEKPF